MFQMSFALCCMFFLKHNIRTYILMYTTMHTCTNAHAPPPHTHTPGLGGRGHERCRGLSLQSSLGWRCPHSGLGGLCTEPSANE